MFWLKINAGVVMDALIFIKIIIWTEMKLYKTHCTLCWQVGT